MRFHCCIVDTYGYPSSAAVCRPFKDRNESFEMEREITSVWQKQIDK